VREAPQCALDADAFLEVNLKIWRDEVLHATVGIRSPALAVAGVRLTVDFGIELEMLGRLLGHHEVRIDAEVTLATGRGW
jgi:hypothetical protein